MDLFLACVNYNSRCDWTEEGAIIQKKELLDEDAMTARH